MKPLPLLAAALLASGCMLHRSPALPAPIPAVNGTPQVAFALRYVDIATGTGAEAGPRKCFFAHYTGWTTDGKQFDSSRDTMPNGKAKSPIAFAQGARGVIAGWDAGFDGMRVGARRRLFIPYQLGYGALGRPPVIPPMAELIFDVELMAVADTLPRTDAPVRGQPPTPTRCPTWATVSGGR